MITAGLYTAYQPGLTGPAPAHRPENHRRCSTVMRPSPHMRSMAASRAALYGEPLGRPSTSLPGPKGDPTTRRSHGVCGGSGRGGGDGNAGPRQRQWRWGRPWQLVRHTNTELRHASSQPPHRPQTQSTLILFHTLPPNSHYPFTNSRYPFISSHYPFINSHRTAYDDGTRFFSLCHGMWRGICTAGGAAGHTVAPYLHLIEGQKGLVADKRHQAAGPDLRATDVQHSKDTCRWATANGSPSAWRKHRWPTLQLLNQTRRLLQQQHGCAPAPPVRRSRQCCSTRQAPPRTELSPAGPLSSKSRQRWSRRG